jgi:NADPH2:quinone reductase
VRAVLLKEFTEHPETLEVTEVPDPQPGPGEVLVQVEAAAINPSDLLNIRGGFGHTKLPRIVGRDFAGRVVEGPAHLRGREVWGAGGNDLGYTRDGTHAQLVALPENAVALRPARLLPEYAAGAGIPFVTAWVSLVERARMVRGDWVVVSGAAGAVGSAAVQIAHYAGAKVIALVKDASERERVDAAKVAAIAQSDKNDLSEIAREATDGKGCNIALNVVGAPIFQPLLESLGRFGRMVIISGRGGRVVEHFDLMNLYRNEYSLIGVDTGGGLTADDGARVLTELSAAFETGQIAPLAVDEKFPLDRAPQAYEAAANGMGKKIVLIP